MTKAKFKKAIKSNMNKYNNTLDQAVWMVRELNKGYDIAINAAELDLITDQMMGRL